MPSQDFSRPANEEEVERMVKLMMHALQEKEFTGADGISAALTFTYRLSKALLSLVADPDGKKIGVEVIVLAMRRVAALIEAEYKDMKGETVH
jgi:hypothetical protein